MATFVLVHGGWHGGWCWKYVPPLLRSAGHDVFTPTLTGVGERAHLARPDTGLETHIQDIVGVLTYFRMWCSLVIVLADQLSRALPIVFLSESPILSTLMQPSPATDKLTWIVPHQRSGHERGPKDFSLKSSS